ncbi:MAG: toll/interleukin-1 receptor domain-containing protein [Pseudomonadota bacterium]
MGGRLGAARSDCGAAASRGAAARATADVDEGAVGVDGCDGKGLEMAKVFLSYASDDVALVDPINEAFHRSGHSVWWDQVMAPTPEAYRDEILKRLRLATCVVTVWTARSVDSVWVRSEARRAFALGKLLQARIALHIDALPMPYDELHCVDLTDWRPDDDEHQGFRNLLAGVESVQQELKDDGCEPEPASPAPRPRRVAEAVPGPAPNSPPTGSALRFSAPHDGTQKAEHETAAQGAGQVKLPWEALNANPEHFARLLAKQARDDRDMWAARHFEEIADRRRGVSDVNVRDVEVLTAPSRAGSGSKVGRVEPRTPSQPRSPAPPPPDARRPRGSGPRPADPASIEFGHVPGKAAPLEPPKRAEVDSTARSEDAWAESRRAEAATPSPSRSPNGAQREARPLQGAAVRGREAGNTVLGKGPEKHRPRITPLPPRPRRVEPVSKGGSDWRLATAIAVAVVAMVAAVIAISLHLGVAE